MRQTDMQVGRGKGLVTVIARDHRYPAGWPAQPAQEKGIDVALAVDFVMMAARREFDVGVLFSSDTDLVPALEAVVALRTGQAPACEVAAWAAPGMRPRLLSVGSVGLGRHLLTEADFRAVADETDYTRSPCVQVADLVGDPGRSSWASSLPSPATLAARRWSPT